MIMGADVKYMVVWSLLCLSVVLNLFFVYHLFVGRHDNQLLDKLDDKAVVVSSISSSGWSRRAAEEAEAVASITCSGHGRAYLDGLINISDHHDDDDKPNCECNSCFSGSDCSQFDPHCPADADSGDPLFLEPFWVQQAASSAIVVAGWHRMSYRFEDKSVISKELEKQIRKLHEMVGNANTTGKFIVFGAGSTQLIIAAVYALSPNGSSSRRVVAPIPFYSLYKQQTDFFNSENFKWQGDTDWKNTSDSSFDFIEFVTSPNNPDGKLKSAVLKSSSVDTIFDHAYYWPHYSAIPAPANEDLMIFTMSKLTGHAGSRFGWLFIKDEAVYERLTLFMGLNSMGVSRDTQLRALKLLKVVTGEGGKEFFRFGHETTMSRWERLNKILSKSKRFSLQKLSPQYCTYFQNVTAPSPAYAWLKCEREEEKDCFAVLHAASIIGRPGSRFSDEDRYVRLSLIKSQDDFDLLLQRMDALVSQEHKE